MQDKIKFKRNAKFGGIQFCDEMKRDIDRTLDVITKIVAHIRDGLVRGDIIKIDKWGFHLKEPVLIVSGDREGKSETFLTAAEYNKAVVAPLYDVDGEWGIKRQILFYVMERFTSYFRRNKLKHPYKKIPTITVSKDKSLQYKESSFIEVDLENKKLLVRTLYGVREVKFTHHSKGELITVKKTTKSKDKVDLPTTGGNFVMKQGVFVAAVDKEVDTLYEPESVKAYDNNVTREDWLAFNDGNIIPMPDNIICLVDEIKILNNLITEKSKPISKRTLRSNQRRSIRKKVRKLHGKLKSEIRKIALNIINEAIDKKQLLCLDGVKTGQANGTFGQDHLPVILQTECENRGIPFYVVPCKGTSARCAVCGHVHGYTKDEKKLYRPSASEFNCQKCGVTSDAQLNAALNVAHQGKRLLDASVPHANWVAPRPRSVDNLVKEYSEEQK